MSKSHRSSHASEICRLEWRPSRWLATILILLGAMAGFAVIASGMPGIPAGPLALALPCWSLWLVRRHLAMPRRSLLWNGHANLVVVDGVTVDQPRLVWRGPLAVISWRAREGRFDRLAWWPDTLPASRRRELRLAAGRGGGLPAAATMAT